MIITTTPSVVGQPITDDYKGIVSGEAIMGVGLDSEVTNMLMVSASDMAVKLT